jgi:FAD-dependent urate hydroxylase
MRVLVVGAGLAGLAVARTLRDRYEVDVVDREPGPSAAGAGIYLPGNAARGLDRLGLLPAVRDGAVTIGAQRYSDRRGRLIGEIDVARYWAGVGPCLGWHRADLHRVVADGIPVRYGTALRDLVQDPDGVEVGFADGTGDRYDLVVGADGIHSRVRDLLGFPGARPVGQFAWRYVVHAPGLVDRWAAQLGRGSAVLALPIGDGRVYCYADVAGEGDEGKELDGYAEPARTLLAADRGPVHAGPVEEVALDRWYAGRTVLVGDAAHATSPNMAQGAAMAIEDALVLTDELGRGAQGRGEEALAAYQARRKPRTDWVMAQTHQRDRIRDLAPPVRALLMRAFGKRAFARNYAPLRAAA